VCNFGVAEEVLVRATEDLHCEVAFLGEIGTGCAPVAVHVDGSWLGEILGGLGDFLCRSLFKVSTWLECCFENASELLEVEIMSMRYRQVEPLSRYELFVNIAGCAHP
jgi:hypothetical protein